MKRTILALAGLIFFGTALPAHALETGNRVVVKVKGGFGCVGAITETVGSFARVKFDEIGHSTAYNCRLLTGDLLQKRFMELAVPANEVAYGTNLIGWGGTKISVGDKILIRVEGGTACVASAKAIVNKYIQASMTREQMVGDCQYLDQEFIAVRTIELAK